MKLLNSIILLKARRDPHKRQVKLVKPHLLQLDFAALGESSDDSDFKLNSGDEAVSDKEAASSDKNSSSNTFLNVHISNNVVFIYV